MTGTGEIIKQCLVVLGLALVTWLVWGIVYRLYLSPVAKFPGRKLAALTLWYEFYYDVVKGGEYIWEIEKMHKQYGKQCLSISACIAD